jgi:hypothetical protein
METGRKIAVLQKTYSADDVAGLYLSIAQLVLFDWRELTMNRPCLSIIIGVFLIFLALPASAQSPAAKPKVPLNNASGSDKSDVKAEADRLVKERRTQARLLLISLAGDARTFRNLTLRARSLMRIADVMWGFDAEQGRALFRKAWEAAETADQNSTLDEMGHWPPNLRGEILKLAARRDRVLVEGFLQKLKGDQEETNTSRSELNSWSDPEASRQRLGLAVDLLGKGDIERALEFAEPLLSSVTVRTVEFLTLLRDKDPAAADQRYATMLANTGVNLQADGNTVSVLSSYIFTPRTFVTFTTEGYPESSWMPTSSPPATVSQQLRLPFFQTAAGVLLRPHAPQEQDQTTAGFAITFMVIKRLMPLFDQYAPQDIVAAMRVKFEALGSLVGDGVRQEESEWIRKGVGPEKPLADQEHTLLDQIERARTSNERDQLYFKLASLALNKDDMKARDYVSRIDNSDFRKRAQAWADGSLAISAIKKKKIERALELARTGELTHIQRVWVLTQAAKFLVKTDHEKAISLLGDATAEARCIEGIDLDRPRGWLAIANALNLIEPSRAWDAILDAINAANGTEGFTGEDGMLSLPLINTLHVGNPSDKVPDFDIEGIFGKLANDDYDRAVQLARGFQGESPRVNATIAIARSVLNEKSTPISKPPQATKK